MVVFPVPVPPTTTMLILPRTQRLEEDRGIHA